MNSFRLEVGDCRDLLKGLPDNSIDAIVTDPPYPEVDRPYGKLSVDAWFDLMKEVVTQSHRVLNPWGSAVYILQPNSEHVGVMRPWLWEFVVWAMKQWNMVQDVYWWNPTTPPNAHCHRTVGLMRPSVKHCVWLGSADCYRNQDEVLWTQSQGNKAVERSNRALKYLPSGLTMRYGRCAAVADERGGVTPFNLIPIANSDSQNSGGAKGHGAATPMALCDWWVRYICPPGGVVLDPFAGSGTVGLAAMKTGRKFIGFEKEASYVEIARARAEDVPLQQGNLQT